MKPGLRWRCIQATVFDGVIGFPAVITAGNWFFANYSDANSIAKAMASFEKFVMCSKLNKDIVSDELWM